MGCNSTLWRKYRRIFKRISTFGIAIPVTDKARLEQKRTEQTKRTWREVQEPIRSISPIVFMNNPG